MLNLIELFSGFEYFKFVAECQTFFLFWVEQLIGGDGIDSNIFVIGNESTNIRISIALWSFAVKSSHRWC